MNLHEYQAKQLFTRYGLPAPTGYACSSADEAVEAAKKSETAHGLLNAKFTQVDVVKLAALKSQAISTISKNLLKNG